jgi:hypothetical protein
MGTPSSIAIASTILVATAIALQAQVVVSAKASLLSYTEGAAYLDGQPVEANSSHVVDLKEGAFLDTSAGRAEILLGACSAMWIGDNSSLQILSNRLTDMRIRLLRGSAAVAIGAAPRGSQTTLLVHTSTVSLGHKGFYRLDAAPPNLAVLAGKAEMVVSGRRISAGAERTLALDGKAAAGKLDKAKHDPLENWSAGRAARLVRTSSLYGQELAWAQVLDDAAETAASGGTWADDPDQKRIDPDAGNKASLSQPVPASSRSKLNPGYGTCGSGR